MVSFCWNVESIWCCWCSVLLLVQKYFVHCSRCGIILWRRPHRQIVFLWLVTGFSPLNTLPASRPVWFLVFIQVQPLSDNSRLLIAYWGILETVIKALLGTVMVSFRWNVAVGARCYCYCKNVSPLLEMRQNPLMSTPPRDRFSLVGHRFLVFEHAASVLCGPSHLFDFLLVTEGSRDRDQYIVSNRYDVISQERWRHLLWLVLGGIISAKCIPACTLLYCLIDRNNLIFQLEKVG